MKELKDLTLKSVLERSVELYPHRPALSWVEGNPLTYREVADKICEISLFLHNQGIIRGDRVAILAENSPNWGIAYLAITTMGSIVVPFCPTFMKMKSSIFCVIPAAKRSLFRKSTTASWMCPKATG